MTNSTAWPAGVLHRFQALKGAYVDIRKSGRYLGSCSGCPADVQFTTLVAATDWGQKHAGKCRGIHQPNVGS